MIKPSIKFSIFTERIAGNLKSKCKIKDLSPSNLTTTVRACIKLLHKQLKERKDHLKKIEKGLAEFTKELAKIEENQKNVKNKSKNN